MKRCYRTSVASVQRLTVTAVIICSILQHQYPAVSGYSCSVQTLNTSPYYHFFLKSIPSTVSDVYDTNGIPHTLDHSSCSYQYRWSSSSICLGYCDDQKVHFTATTGVTTGNLHAELTVPSFHLCKSGTSSTVTKTVRVYKKCSGSYVHAFTSSDFSISIDEVTSCSCQDSISKLNITGVREFVKGYASDAGTELDITDV